MPVPGYPLLENPYRRRMVRYSTATLIGLALAAGPALTAQAHVHVHPDSTVAGGDSVLTFKVPTESETASTTKLVLTLPSEHPFAEVAARSMPGWKVAVVNDELPTPVDVAGTTLTTAAHTVTWTAEPDSGIPPEQYETFELTVGPLPASGEVMFAASQTYSDGSVVAWDEPTVGAEEPEHPAPAFAVTPATAPADTVAEEPASSDPFTRLLAGAGLLAGLAAIGLIVARRSPRRPVSSPAPVPGSAAATAPAPVPADGPADAPAAAPADASIDAPADVSVDAATDASVDQRLDLASVGVKEPS
jgi:uncharacterized protein YcnI